MSNETAHSLENLATQSGVFALGGDLAVQASFEYGQST